MNERSFRPSRIALALALAASVHGAPAFAQRASLADRVAALEQRAASNQGNVDLLNQVNALKTEVSQLRAQIEELQQQAAQAQSTARAQYLDLDGRLNRLEGSPPTAPPRRSRRRKPLSVLPYPCTRVPRSTTRKPAC